MNIKSKLPLRKKKKKIRQKSSAEFEIPMEF